MPFHGWFTISYSLFLQKIICFDMSFESGIFPGEMKIAKIVPLFKNGNLKEFSSDRPVSILPYFFIKDYYHM